MSIVGGIDVGGSGVHVLSIRVGVEVGVIITGMEVEVGKGVMLRTGGDVKVGGVGVVLTAWGVLVMNSLTFVGALLTMRVSEAAAIGSEARDIPAKNCGQPVQAVMIAVAMTNKKRRFTESPSS